MNGIKLGLFKTTFKTITKGELTTVIFRVGCIALIV